VHTTGQAEFGGEKPEFSFERTGAGHGQARTRIAKQHT
jgi:hypothetical protein